MKNQSLLIIVAVVIVLGAGAFFLSQSQKTPDAMIDKTGDQIMENDSLMQDDEMMKEDEGSMMQDDGAEMHDRYVAYTPQAFAAASNEKRVLYFHADWCPTCRPFNAELSTRTSEIPSGVVVFKTNYDTETALKQKYGITYQHTFVIVDSAGNEVSKWNGGSVDEFLSRISR
ncbi:thioredoxin [Candidatus Microgenomates bacterium]|nr:MAG: thioredoxin [Candidatus Microgenomates bacterium]